MLPLLIWGAAGCIAWINRKKIADWFNSSESDKFFDVLGKAVEGYVKPYEDTLEKIYPMDSDMRKAVLREAKKRMTPFNWGGLLGYIKTSAGKNAKYLASYIDASHVDNER